MDSRPDEARPEGKRHRISIITAAYNVEKEIRIFLDSLCASEHKDFELCLCDDASQDRTLDIVRTYRDRLNIRLTGNTATQGVTFSRNKAFGLAKAPLVLFMDADIRIYPDTLSKLLETRGRTRADVVEGIYSPVALDHGLFSRYYALLIHHSFLISNRPVEYNVFNAWCALCERTVIETIGKHAVLKKGVEVENESLGRRIVAAGFSLLLDPSISVDHHWGGHGKLIFIFTRRVYWWVKVFFSTGCRFETSLTTPSYGLATLCFPAAAVSGVAGAGHPSLWALSALFLGGFLAGYAPFYGFVLRRKGASLCLASIFLSMYFSLFISASAIWSSLEEAGKRIFLNRYSLDPAIFRPRGERTPRP